MRVALLAAGTLVSALAGCAGSEAPSDATASTADSEASPSPAQTVESVGKPNGVETLDPQRILKRAERAARGARSVRIAGSGPDASLDLVVTKSASDGERTSGDVTLRTRVVDGTLYIKADESYWTEAFSAKKAQRIGDKWVTGDLDNPRLGTFRQTSTLRPLLRQFLRTPGEAEAGEDLAALQAFAASLPSSQEDAPEPLARPEQDSSD